MSSREYASVASAWWLIIIGIVLLFFPPLFWLGIIFTIVGIIAGIAGWANSGSDERRSVRESGELASEYLAGVSGGWLIVLGVLLFIIPTPLTTLVGIIIILVGIAFWIAAWWSG
jgi:hypothetical protein